MVGRLLKNKEKKEEVKKNKEVGEWVGGINIRTALKWLKVVQNGKMLLRVS
jgi:hypothetical protein